MMARASQHKIRAKSECKIKAGGNKPASFFAYLFDLSTRSETSRKLIFKIQQKSLLIFSYHLLKNCAHVLP
jgi:hypothetical protein